MNKIEEILTKIGLTDRESRVYLALLGLQQAQTGLICNFTRIASSNIYKILDSLIQKGLVSFRMQNNIKIFMPSPPDYLNELFLEKQRKLEEERVEINELIINLKKKEIKKEPYSNYKYFEGLSGIKSLWYNINSIMDKENMIKIHTCKPGSYERLVGFYTEYHNLRVKKQVRERMIFPNEGRWLAKKRRNKLTEIRFMDLKNDVEWGVMKGYFFLQYITGKSPRGFLIKDEKFSQTFEQVFDNLWGIAKEEPLKHI